MSMTSKVVVMLSYHRSVVGRELKGQILFMVLLTSQIQTSSSKHCMAGFFFSHSFEQ